MSDDDLAEMKRRSDELGSRLAEARRKIKPPPEREAPKDYYWTLRAGQAVGIWAALQGLTAVVSLVLAIVGYETTFMAKRAVIGLLVAVSLQQVSWLLQRKATRP